MKIPLKYPMGKLPPNFNQHVENLTKLAAQIEGYLTPQEVRFLCLLGVFQTASGEVLEIGSFKGKSTVILAKSVQLSGEDKIIAVDPLSLPSDTDPFVRDSSLVVKDFKQNLKEQNVEHMVEFHQMLSQDLGAKWDRKLRLLWIDGDHTYAGAKLDFDMFSPFLSDGAIIAIHDVLHPHKGPIRVFMEDILLSAKFGPCGVCGSIGWAQYLNDSQKTQSYFDYKIYLYKKLSKLVPHIALNRRFEGFNKIFYKLKRSRVPHQPIKTAKWCQTIQTNI